MREFDESRKIILEIVLAEQPIRFVALESKAYRQIGSIHKTRKAIYGLRDDGHISQEKARAPYSITKKGQSLLSGLSNVQNEGM